MKVANSSKVVVHPGDKLFLEFQWDKAIACSPHVSLEYWKSLVDRRAESLMDEESEEAVAYSIAGGNLEETVQVRTYGEIPLAIGHQSFE